MPNKLPTSLNRECILKAINGLDLGVEHLFSESTGYDLLFKGKRYAPKAVVGIAAEIQTGEKFGPYDFKGGRNSRCFRLLEINGFDIVAKGEVALFPDEISTSEPHSEGSVVRVAVNRFERDDRARAASVEHYGFRCQVCSFDFREKYGDLGSGFIHVHHLVPLSQIRTSYLVDPVRDLVPICPNCHAMIHRRDPPFSVKELKDLIKSNEPTG